MKSAIWGVNWGFPKLLLGVIRSQGRAAARSEIEKLCLYAGDTSNLTLDDVRASIGDAGSVSLEDAAFAATEGNRVAADTALERALAEDTSPIAIARSFLGHLHRLRRVRAAMASGVSRSEAVKALRPPVFFKRTASFNRALELWSLPALTKAVEETQALEYACKQTGSPDGMGLFENLHGMPGAGDLADHIRRAARTHYGTASRAYLDALVKERADDEAGLASGSSES